jgi:3-oxoacyl-[acyl-carrier protein] reductase
VQTDDGQNDRDWNTVAVHNRRIGLTRAKGETKMSEANKCALVTGASQGIGAATARVLAAEGYRVIIHYGSQRERTEALAAEIRAAGGSADVVGADLAQPNAAHELAAQVTKLCGGKLDALILNAAIMPTSDLDNCTPEVFDDLFHINLRSPFFLLQQLTPALAEGASVVFLSSVTAKRGLYPVAAYGSMKYAIESLTRRAAVALGERWIRVNAVAPATTASETVAPHLEHPAMRDATIAGQALKRIAQPEDVADVIGFLCSDKARWITGALIPVDGGTLL